MRLHPGDEQLEVVGRKGFSRHEQLRIDRYQSDWRKCRLQIVIGIVDDAGNMRVPLAYVDDVAVRYGPRDAPHSYAAAGSATILDDDRLPEHGCHAVRQNASRHIRGTV